MQHSDNKLNITEFKAHEQQMFDDKYKFLHIIEHFHYDYSDNRKNHAIEFLYNYQLSDLVIDDFIQTILHIFPHCSNVHKQFLCEKVLQLDECYKANIFKKIFPHLNPTQVEKVLIDIQNMKDAQHKTDSLIAIAVCDNIAYRKLLFTSAIQEKLQEEIQGNVISYIFKDYSVEEQNSLLMPLVLHMKNTNTQLEVICKIYRTCTIDQKVSLIEPILFSTYNLVSGDKDEFIKQVSHILKLTEEDAEIIKLIYNSMKVIDKLHLDESKAGCFTPMERKVLTSNPLWIVFYDELKNDIKKHLQAKEGSYVGYIDKPLKTSFSLSKD